MAFKLKSGNKVSFKDMGSSPVKQKLAATGVGEAVLTRAALASGTKEKVSPPKESEKTSLNVSRKSTLKPKTVAKQKVDETMKDEAAREDEKMKEIAIKRGWKFKMVEKPDGTRENVKVKVDKDGNEIKTPAKNYKKGYYGVK
jgi:hypothetical protein